MAENSAGDDSSRRREENDAFDRNIEALRRQLRNCRHGGPTEEEQGLPYFQAATRFLQFENTWLDRLGPGSSMEEIQTAIQQTVRFIVNDPFLDLMRASPGSMRYFGALAVDAWANDDMPYVKKFLIKGLFVTELLRKGPSALLREHGSLDGDEAAFLPILARKIQQVLREQEIRTHLKHLTHGSCRCVELAEVFVKADEIGNETAQAARKQKEKEQVPAILKPQSKFYKIKQKAASHLKANRLDKAIEFYQKAAGLLDNCIEEHKRERTPRDELLRAVSEECGRVHSNLSMIYCKKKNYDLALVHANEAVGKFPNWSKPHARRALALEGLSDHHLQDAEAAICNALEIVDSEIMSAEDDASEGKVRHTKEEYQQIEQRIAAALAKQQPTKESSRIPTISADFAEAGAFTGVLGVGHVLERVAEFLSPRDVARLEQTCRGFAAQPERRRRCCLTSALLWNNSSNLEVQKRVAVYCSERLDDPRRALRNLIETVLPLVSGGSASTGLSTWLQYMLNHTSVVARNTIQDVCIGMQEPLREPLSSWIFSSLSCHGLISGSHLDDDDILRMFQRDEDSQLLRVISWVSPLLDEDAEDPDNDLLEIRDQCFFAVNNLVSEGSKIQKEMRQIGESYPAFQLIMAISSIFSEKLPRQGPCASFLEREWNYSSDDVDAFFSRSDPRELRRWRAALVELLEWAKTIKSTTAYIELTLMCQLVVVEGISHDGSTQMNQFSMAVFVLKKCMENGGGADVLLQSMVRQRDVAEFIADFYSMIRLYNDAMPKCLAWRERAMAQRNMMMG